MQKNVNKLTLFVWPQNINLLERNFLRLLSVISHSLNVLSELPVTSIKPGVIDKHDNDDDEDVDVDGMPTADTQVTLP